MPQVVDEGGFAAGLDSRQDEHFENTDRRRTPRKKNGACTSIWVQPSPFKQPTTRCNYADRGLMTDADRTVGADDQLRTNPDRMGVQIKRVAQPTVA